MQNLAPLLTIGVLILVMYFLVLRPQKQRMMEQARLVSSLEVGDEVLTSAGIFGKIRRMSDDRLELETAGGTRLEILKSTVIRRMSEDAGASRKAVEATEKKALAGSEGADESDSLE